MGAVGGLRTAIQGNLDPTVLLAPWDVVEREALDVLDRAGGRSGHVFNLGHGVLPDTPVENLQRLVDLVHARIRARWLTRPLGSPSSAPALPV